MTRTMTIPTWTTSYDSAGQAPSLVLTSSVGQLGIQMLPDRLTLDLRGQLSMAGAVTPDPSSTDGGNSDIVEEDFRIECFVPEFNPTSVGVAPFAPLPPVPITLGVQARVRAADETLHVDVSAIEVAVLTTP